MANNDNLKKGKATQFQSGDKAAKNGKKGGIASGIARREKKNMREWAEIFGSKEIEVTIGKTADGGKITEKTDFDGATVFSMYQQAINRGNTKAAKLLMQLKGELEEKLNVTGDGVTIVVESKKQADKLKNIGKIGG